MFILNLAHGRRSSLEYHRVLFWDMFPFLREAQFTGYADDNTPFVVRDNITDVISALEEIGEKPLIWLSHNQMKLNTVKCHLLLNTQN